MEVVCTFNGACYFKSEGGHCVNTRDCPSKSKVYVHSQINRKKGTIKVTVQRLNNVVPSDNRVGMSAGVYYATYGHWTLALLKAGFRVDWHHQPRMDVFSRPDLFASKILRANFPSIPIAPIGKPDIITGSPPCIGFAGCNPNSGPDHPANKNFINCFKMINEIGPKFFLVEMVPRILKVGQPVLEKAMDEVTPSYQVSCQEFEVSDYGSPARRARLYFFGARNELKVNPGEVLKDFTSDGRKGKALDILGKTEYTKYDEVNEVPGEVYSRYGQNGKLRTGPYRAALMPSRVLKPNEPAFTITGMVYESLKHWKKRPDGLERFLAIQEIADFMGFPVDYDYCTESIPTRCHIIASGVDVRFTQKLLEYLAEGVMKEVLFG